MIYVPVNTGSGVGGFLGYYFLMMLGFLGGIVTFIKTIKEWNNKSVSKRDIGSVEYIYGKYNFAYLLEYRFLCKDSFVGFCAGAMYTKGGLIVFIVSTLILCVFIFGK